MKFSLLIAAVILSMACYAQRSTDTKISATLTFPNQETRRLNADKPLVILFDAVDANEKAVTGKISAVKTGEDAYSFSLKQLYFL